MTTRREVFTITEGPVILEWPAPISAESYEDLCSWLDLLKRQMQRAVTAPVHDDAIGGAR